MSKLSRKKPTAAPVTAVTADAETAPLQHQEAEASNLHEQPSGQHDAMRMNAIRRKTLDQIFSRQQTVEVPVSLIEDEVGTDRSHDWQNDPEIEALAYNIQKEGQMTPVELRVSDPNWVPRAGRYEVRDIQDDEDVKFLVQAGRRRIEACRRLGIKVVAFLNAGELYDDLRKRFFENSMRQDLTPIDFLRSVGGLAKEMQQRTEGVSGETIAKELGVNRQYVVNGLKVLSLETEINTLPNQGRDLTHTALRKLLPQLTSGEPVEAVTAVTAEDSPTAIAHDDIEIGQEQDTREVKDHRSRSVSAPPIRQTRRFAGYQCHMDSLKTGADLKIRGGKISDETLQKIGAAIEDILRDALD
ncbi:hypothetical protein AYJ57_21650 (plasmid) [Salipiger sp. CCB-MM3]|uniref:ParB/RepB/Spo0J family partition protein n=1 Tax=Salipiger sp. CCB-MM3 TaxID=1792508 RepID=UPI00080ABFDF|nr:ParB/RepB/Spo0J family partition protein [Salipiger sp. CCB-MM3]ANT63079.1 hypothetical protein AYJ57_21650 [Salipiger sp. CCB-MM3]